MRHAWFVIIIAVFALIIAAVKTNLFTAAKAPADFDRSITQLVYTKHARCRMNCRKIDESEVKEILKKGTVNFSKSEPYDKPDPKFALEGLTHDKQRVRIVFAPSKEKVVVITVIDLGTDLPCSCN